ncbi:uncharacterized protein HLK63_F05665 [Nakaseomyces glabratus]|nr:D-arabinose 1-dehydrogenase (NAD+) [Nakaseomyces glabratus]OXB43823.1 hypothetical protein B1J91_F06061g [Nakaseomyces glabratus]OXB49122.1 hypothetical protein B1J92_F06061g [Nakaseomyces glabratus]UCS20205.1 uncharacterized protein GW608_F05665 [Nakaseomyces glabratus]UCS25436.1 uncharacterized protein HLK63_F05665 [Nakaseomyces glabratus]
MTVDHNDITKVSKIILGGATLNTQYNDNPEEVPIVDMLRHAFTNGINAIDTSPYYGPSEIIFGQALHKLKSPDEDGLSFTRDQYYICTKVGRIKLEEFDYSPKAVRASVLRSCERLDTDYLDLVYLHDVEFVEFTKSMEALKELRKLKEEGVIRHFGLSGYPVKYLAFLCNECAKHPEIGPLDAVLSYCNYNIQNTTLEKYINSIRKDAKVKLLSNASILGMSLLRSQGIHSFHPASDELKAKCRQAAEYTHKHGVEIQDLANRYAMFNWHKYGPTVIGVSNVAELQDAIIDYQITEKDKLPENDIKLVKHIQEEILGTEHYNETWDSGIPHPELP